jgi:hypothetical protein
MHDGYHYLIWKFLDIKELFNLFVAPFAVCALNRNNIIIKAKKGQDIMKNTQSKYTMYEHLYCKN